jgi:hypothetical protein
LTLNTAWSYLPIGSSGLKFTGDCGVITQTPAWALDVT